MIYVLACYGYSWLDKLIQKVDGHKTSHIAIQITDSIIAESSWFGVKLNSLQNKNGNYVKLQFKDIDEATQHKLFLCILDMVGKKPYDYKLFFGIVINKGLAFFDRFGFNWRVHFDNPKKMICAEVIVEAFKQITGKDLLPDIKDEDIVPDSILSSPYLEVAT